MVKDLDTLRVLMGRGEAVSSLREEEPARVSILVSLCRVCGWVFVCVVSIHLNRVCHPVDSSKIKPL